MRLYIIIFITWLGFGALTESQAQVNQQTKIILKNGVKINGAILESINDQYLSVKVSNSTEPVLLKFDHIKRISFKGKSPLTEEMEKKIEEIPGLKLKSFYHEFKGGILFGEENISGSLHTINGYQFNKYLGTGLGIGMNKFGNYTSLPIYATVKGYLLDQKVCPFYFGDIGYGFAWRNNMEGDGFLIDNVKGGLYWQLGAGYQFNFHKTSLVLTLGYLNQSSKADYTYLYWADGVEISEKRLLRRVNFSVGFLF